MQIVSWVSALNLCVLEKELDRDSVNGQMVYGETMGNWSFDLIDDSPEKLSGYGLHWGFEPASTSGIDCNGFCVPSSSENKHFLTVLLMLSLSLWDTVFAWS